MCGCTALGGGSQKGISSNDLTQQTLTDLYADFDAAAHGKTVHETFVNGYGDHTWFDYYPVPLGEQLCNNPIGAPQIVQHVTKDNPRTYFGWTDQPAELWGVLAKHDGLWSFNGSVMQFAQSDGTISTMSGMNVFDDVPHYFYAMTPGVAVSTGFNKTLTGSGHFRILYNVWYMGCLNAGDTGTTDLRTLQTWSKFSVENVSTPVYSGPALRVDLAEGIGALSKPDQRENWWFAPGWGVVQIKPVSKTDPALIIKRVK